jgi:MFS family permease
MRSVIMPILSSVRREYRSLPTVFWALWLGTLVNKAGGFVVPFLAIYVGRLLRLGDATAGAIVSLYGAGSLLAGVTGGLLADRVGRRATMVTSLFGGAVAMIGLALFHGVLLLGGFALLTGWLTEMYRPAVAAMIADVVPQRDRPRAYAHLYWVVNLGFALAAPLAGLALRTSYLSLFAVDAATMAIYGCVVLARVPESRPPIAAAHESERGALATLARDVPFLGFVLLLGATALVMWQSGSTLPLDMMRHGISTPSYGALMAINGVVIIVLQPLITRWLSGGARARWLAAASIVFGIGFGLYGVVSTRAGYAAAVLTWTLAEIVLVPTASAQVADLAPPALRGRYQGTYATAWGTASAVGQLLGGALLAGPGPGVLWGGCLALMLVVAAGHLALGGALSARSDGAKGLPTALASGPSRGAGSR